MRRFPFVILAALAISGCNREGTVQQRPGTDIGIETAWMDKSVMPGDDFAGYADGTWVKNTPIPEDRSSIGGFYVADLQREKITRELFDNILKSNAAADTND